MKAIILAGGLGSRLSEETDLRPKPLVEIGGRPIIWHIMKIYSQHGINDFIVCLGYKGYMIKEYFSNYRLHISDVTVDLRSDKIDLHPSDVDPWRITLVDTGDQTNVGGRIKRVIPFVEEEEAFCVTYGDGVSNVNIRETIDFHRSRKRLATVTAIQAPGRFGFIRFDGDKVTNFQEKPEGEGRWINGGFFVLSPKVAPYIDGDESVWEREPVERLVADQQLSVYRHSGFWHSMDTLRDKRHLEALWASGEAPWKIW